MTFADAIREVIHYHGHPVVMAGTHESPAVWEERALTPAHPSYCVTASDRAHDPARRVGLTTLRADTRGYPR